MKDDDFQMMAMQMAAKAEPEDSSHIVGSAAPRRRITSLTTPYSVWKNHAKISPAKDRGSAQGSSSASRWQQFWQITIPMLMPSIIVALIFRTITALQTFDIPYTMTRGGPGNATETLAMRIHKTTIEYLDVGYGSTLAVCMFLLSLGVTAIYLRRIGRE